MNLKRVLAVVISATFMLGLMACSPDSASDDVKVIDKKGTGNPTGAAEDAGDGYVFSYKGTDIPVDSEASEILDALGEPNSYFEAPSCAAQGIGKHYTYNDFEIETYPDGSKDYILYVLLKSDAVSTKEGINTSSSADEIKEVYGEPQSEVAGSLIYEKDGMKLKFIFKDDALVSIEYDSPLA